MRHYDDDFARAVPGLVLALLAALIFGAMKCGSCRPEEQLRAGFVVRRDYHPPYTTQVCSVVGKVTVCHPVYHPERFSVTLADGDHDERTVDMSEGAWRAHDVGHWACLHSGRCERPHDDAEHGR